MTQTEAQRFWPRIKQGDNGCWEWTGQCRANGYGSFAVRVSDGRWTTTTAHRWSYAEQVAPIPPGYEVDHLCKNRACVRPDHLEAVTLQENRRRRDRGHVVELDCSQATIPVAPAPPVPQQRKRPSRSFIGPRLRRQLAPATACKNGHEYAVFGKVKNGKNETCAECRRIQYAAKRKGTGHGTETHCPKGHPYSGDNLYLRPNGGRECRTCVYARNRAAYNRRKAAREG